VASPRPVVRPMPHMTATHEDLDFLVSINKVLRFWRVGRCVPPVWAAPAGHSLIGVPWQQTGTPMGSWSQTGTMGSLTRAT
jgi:hypothetical protein